MRLPSPPEQEAVHRPLLPCASGEELADAAGPAPRNATFALAPDAPERPVTARIYMRWVRPLLGGLLVVAILPLVATIVAFLAVVHLALMRRPSHVFFIQERAGRHGKPFRIVKFRTMEPDETGTHVPTPFGALLRKSHLDELPQLWNVLRGEMSLIGPRPETLDLETWGETVAPGFQSRLSIKPGITGLAQVVQDSTPAQTDLYREKLRLNLRYMDEISFGTDLWILFQTALRPIRPRPFERSGLKGN